MGLFSKLFQKEKTIKVQFIDDSTGETIGVSNMPPGKLPATFELETTMHLGDAEWRIEEASPLNAVDFIKSGNLTLKMHKVEYLNVNDVNFMLPTISNELPDVSDKVLSNNYEIQMTDDDWRQNEFLNKSLFPLIDIEIEKIRDIWANHSKTIKDSYTLFKKCHVRDAIGEPDLSIDFTELKRILGLENAGSLKFLGTNDFVLNGFSLVTATTTFYGILNNGTVTHLCISSFSDESINEIEIINQFFGIIFVNWYHCDIIAKDA